MITVTLNDVSVSIQRNLSLEAFLKQHVMLDTGFAVVRNACFVPKAYHAACLLQDGDTIELIIAMQGG